MDVSQSRETPKTASESEVSQILKGRPLALNVGYGDTSREELWAVPRIVALSHPLTSALVVRAAHPSGKWGRYSSSKVGQQVKLRGRFAF